MRLSWTVLLIAAWLVIPAVAQSEAEKPSQKHPRLQARPQGERGGGLEAYIDRIRDQLELDEDQLVQFDRIRQQFAGRPGERGTFRKFLDEVGKILRDDQREKLAEIKERIDRKRGPHARLLGLDNPLGQLKRLRRELQLTEEQGAQFDDLYAKLTEELKQGRRGSLENQELVEQLIEAVEAGDEARIEELKGTLSDPRAQAREAVGRFLEKLEPLLEPEQKRILRRFRQQMRPGRGRFDLEAMFRAVQRLDLDEEQRERLREIQHDAQAATRDARRDPEAMAKVTAEIEQQLRDMLTNDQVVEFDRWLEARHSKKPERGPKGHHKRHGHGSEGRAEPKGEPAP
jgi:Spy/CpxP family protein refolding chaperone